MTRSAVFQRSAQKWFWLTAILLIAGFVFTSGAQALEVNLVDGEGNPLSIPYRFTIERDETYHHVPGTSGETEPTSALSLNFDKSYMPLVMTGNSVDDAAALAGFTGETDAHYFISVLPTDPGAYNMGGAPIRPGDTSVTVTLNSLPTPTAQISVFVFEDMNPINNVPDLPAERGLAGFEIKLAEAGGRFGANGGPITQDAFGNQLVNSALDGIDDPGQTATVGRIVTNEHGIAIIKNLPPAKYGVTISQPLGGGWIQTSTIEGSKTIDAWVKANEPPYFTEFGPAGHHADFGFVRLLDGSEDRNGDGFPDLHGDATVSGRIVSTHMSRPPDYTMWAGHPFPDCYVGLNDAAGVGIWAQACGDGSTFSIPNVPSGSYTLSIWDNNLDMVFAQEQIVVTDGVQAVDMGDVGVFDWFAHLQGRVFWDDDKDGFPDPTEGGLAEQAVNIRWRDGTIYDSKGTDSQGNYAFDEVFPFFSWLVAEVDFARFKATGMTAVVDAGGEVLPHDGWTWPSYDRLTPQPQADPNPNTGNNLSRTETGEVLTQGFQAFLGQTNVIHWGKNSYGANESGGISGMVYYDTTRAEDDPRYNGAETWQPGIPRVQVVLYESVFDPVTDEPVIADRNGSGTIELADVDNYPFGWADGSAPMGPEDVKRNGSGDVFDRGDAIGITTTDSWDDVESLPDGCPGADPSDPAAVQPDKCYDGLRNFNQVRDAVFDGGFAFPGYNATNNPNGLQPGNYIVEAVPPKGYKLVRAEDKNVDFGEEYTPSPLALPAVCVGDDYDVPAYYSLFADTSADFPKPVNAGDPLKECNRKHVYLQSGLNAPAEFFFFTDAPVAAHVKGFILDDLANEFDPNNPNFGEKFAPPWLPVAFYDYNGKEITRVYSDEYGTYNALVPATFTANVASPSGMGPNMLIACMNDPGPIPDPNNPGQFITDPYFRPQYTQFCYTFQYMPGATTYLDTPVLPIAAFAGADQFPLDCEYPDLTPVINTVSAESNTHGGGPYVQVGDVLTITSVGTAIKVRNPAYEPGVDDNRTILRNYGFGISAGTIHLTNGEGIPSGELTVNTWSEGAIDATVQAGTAPGAYQLTVEKSDGTVSPMGVTVTVVNSYSDRTVWAVGPNAAPGATPIQDAIDMAQVGDLILVAPGVYDELVIMYKPVQIQGWGAPSVVINAVKRPGEKVQIWRNKILDILDIDHNIAGVPNDPAAVPGPNRLADLLPGQNVAFDPANNEPGLMTTSEGAGITVLAHNPETAASGTFGLDPNARIDGLSITGADIGGAIVVNGYANYLEISNMKIFANEGHEGGGIQVGHPLLADGPEDAFNDFLSIHHNWISQNGSPNGAPGGIAIYSGADGYRIEDNYICGNYATGSGGGIGHIGLSDQGRIEDNIVVFNQSFNQMPMDIGGGGIAIEGAQVPGQLTAGAGDVIVLSNLIQSNVAGAGDGGGLRLAYVNGLDVEANGPASNRHRIDVFNNIIVNNAAGASGGGMSLKDAVNVRIINNTIAHNDSTATIGALVKEVNPDGSTQSNPQPGAGLVSRAHTPILAVAITGNDRGFSEPSAFDSNIIYRNRQFYWRIDAGTGVGSLLYSGISDLAVQDAPGTPLRQERLNPRYSLLTDTTGYNGNNNVTGPDDPALLFEIPYVNDDGIGGMTSIPEDATPLTAAATDEGGNFIDIRFSPLTLQGDYHIKGNSLAIDVGANLPNNEIDLDTDFDDDPRPRRGVDIGADEFVN
jgi:hypothetical protein